MITHHISKNRPIFVRLQPHHIVPNSTADFARTLVCSKNFLCKEAGSAWIWFFIGICPCFKRDAFRVLKLWDWKFDALLVPPKKKVSCFQGFFQGQPLEWGQRSPCPLCISRWFFFENLTSKSWARRQLPASSSEISITWCQDLSLFLDQNDLCISLGGGQVDAKGNVATILEVRFWLAHGDVKHFYRNPVTVGSPSTPMTQQLPCRPKLHCMVLIFVPMVRTSKLSYFDELKRMLGFFCGDFHAAEFDFSLFQTNDVNPITNP